MNLNFSSLPRWVAGTLLISAISTVHAEPAAQGTPAKKAADPSAVAAEQANYRAVLGDAREFARRGNLAAAEHVLTSLNRGKPNTATWHIETAQRLIQIAEQLAREGNTAGTSALAGTALQHLAVAESIATTPNAKAASKSLAGFIHERYLADSDAALASYKAAATIDPSSKRAAEIAGRLQQSSDDLHAKGHGK